MKKGLMLTLLKKLSTGQGMSTDRGNQEVQDRELSADGQENCRLVLEAVSHAFDAIYLTMGNGRRGLSVVYLKSMVDVQAQQRPLSPFPQFILQERPDSIVTERRMCSWGRVPSSSSFIRRRTISTAGVVFLGPAPSHLRHQRLDHVLGDLCGGADVPLRDHSGDDAQNDRPLAARACRPRSARRWASSAASADPHSCRNIIPIPQDSAKSTVRRDSSTS
jgi:hypothetical protein